MKPELIEGRRVFLKTIVGAAVGGAALLAARPVMAQHQGATRGAAALVE